MFIKEIRLNGFKSYKNETVIENFHKGFNVIIGRNGSGKSNLFMAIQLALTNEYNSMKHSDRVALLSNSRDPNDPAYVEVIFDNTDRELPFEDDTVTFRRMIACKKDRLLINGIDVTMDNSILTAAGFLNPFYLVKQGRINAVASATDAARLLLIKEISGVLSYEEKKVNVLKQLGASKASMDKAGACLSTMEDEKAKLSRQVKDLEEFEKLDKKKRAIEFVIADRDVQKFTEKLTKLDERRQEVVSTVGPANAHMAMVSNRLEKIRDRIAIIQKIVTDYEAYKAEIAGEMHELMGKEVQIVNNVAEIRNELHELGDAQYRYTEVYASRRKDYREAKKEFDILVLEYETLKKMELQSSLAYSSAEAAVKSLEVEMRLSPAERLGALQMEEKSLLTLLSKEEDQHRRTVQSLNKLKGECLELQDEVSQIRRQRDSTKKEVVASEGKAFDLNLDYEQHFNNRKEVWAGITAAEQTILTKREELEAQLQVMKRVAGRCTINGWQGVRQILEVMKTKQNNKLAKDTVEGYYGLVLENLKCPEEYATAVEVVGAKKLFFHVVKNLAVGRTILSEFNRMRYDGEVAFLPLEEIQLRQFNFPARMERMHPLLDVIQHDSVVANAMKSVFGGVLVCESLELASTTSKTYKVNCVTMDGDKVSFSGAMTGGYRDRSLSVLKAQNVRVHLLEKISTSKELKTNLEVDEAAKNGSIQSLGSAIEQNKSRLASLKINDEKLFIELKLKNESIRDMIKSEASGLKTMEAAKQKILECKNRLKAIRVEKDRDVDPTHEGNLASFHQLKATVKECAEKNKINYVKRLECEKKKDVLERKMSFLKDAQADDEHQLGNTPSLVALAARIESLERQAETVQKQILVDRTIIDETAGVLDRCIAKLDYRKRELDEWEGKKQVQSESVDGIAAKLLSLDQDRQELNGKLGDLKSKVAALGTLPAEVDRLVNDSSKELFKKLEGLAEQMARGDGNVNRLAADQLQGLELGLDQFTTQFSLLSTGNTALSACVETLDRQKGDVVLKTARSLQLAFEEIFAELVPNGYGEMILYGSGEGVSFKHADGLDAIDPEIATRKQAKPLSVLGLDLLNRRQLSLVLPAMQEIKKATWKKAIKMWNQDLFTGVSVRVIFNKHGNQPNLQDINSLSGGQKSIVALSIIMALQKCDPTALYLFDEIDQALDPENRVRVAEKIKQLSENAQFICTTFRKEFVDQADAIFGVSFGHYQSHVQIQSREQAMDFVQEDEPPSELSSDMGVDSDLESMDVNSP